MCCRCVGASTSVVRMPWAPHLAVALAGPRHCVAGPAGPAVVGRLALAAARVMSPAGVSSTSLLRPLSQSPSSRTSSQILGSRLYMYMLTVRGIRWAGLALTTFQS